MNVKYKSLLIIFLILLADQILKIWVKTHMMLGDEFIIAKNWFIIHFVENNGMAFGFELGTSFIIHFVENNGMAFGFELGTSFGKYILSIFRIVAVGALGWYLSSLWKRKVPFGIIVSFSLIMAGAIGNILDSAYFGLIFNDSYGKVATLFPPEGGYAGFLQGRVVDMFYFPLISGHYPIWLPFVGGQEFIFFRPVFNIADSSITVGIFIILIFYRHFFDQKKEGASEESAEKIENKSTI